MKKSISLLLIMTLVLALLVPFNSQTTKADSLAHLGENLKDTLDNIDNTELVEIVVTYDQDEPITESQRGALEDLGIEAGVFMQSLPIAGLVATKSQIELLQEQQQITSIFLNEELEYYNAESNDLTGVERLQTDSNFHKENNGMPFSGDGIGVVVHDSGVDGLHKDVEYGSNLVENVMASANLNALEPELLPITYQEGIANTDTNSGHGTHVAGTVGGTGAHSGGKHAGVAPGADLIGYGSGAALFVLDAIGGFDYAITNQTKFDIRVITNSWGSSGDFNPLHPVNVASKKTYDRGISVLFAAGNSGPGENTHNPYAKAPWVISVGAGVKDGTLADFSSRGTEDAGGTFDLDGETWSWKDEPTVVAPGVDVISAKTISPLNVISAEQDAEMIETAYMPYYTVKSGTSMATPHVAGIVALMLEADPTLSPDEIKHILQQTATNMSGYDSWEVGAGYVNAYAALDQIVFNKEYGTTLNINEDFNSSVDTQSKTEPFTVDYNPVTYASGNVHHFNVEEGINSISVRVDAEGVIGATGNPINLVLVDPEGNEYSSGISVLFTLFFDRTVMVSNPMPGEWQAKLVGLRGVEENPLGIALPEEIDGTIKQTTISGYTGMDDIDGHPAEEAIKLGVSERLVDGYSNGKFKPHHKLTRGELAQYLVMGANIRQNLNQLKNVTEVPSDLQPYASAVTARGSALRNTTQDLDGVMLLDNGSFNEGGTVSRADLAYSLVQALGLENEANNFDGDVTVQYKDERLVIDDQDDIPEHLKGYVQVALDLNILNAHFELKQGPFDLEPEVHATFSPTDDVTRGEYAVASTRYQAAFFK
ncbi:serine protease AprX [Alkalibacillus filiformis]|uniref:Serine protease AprX n=1 Tax=Alkalibacillus filiformis TaxID=200990 RepID=A0ABU0DST8_9BACI|nr:S8 family serine peptidase [Alkalibacillus filiformis]MDQ0351495.1 serine protease AprX [Alkalibacillus filiformis]